MAKRFRLSRGQFHVSETAIEQGIRVRIHVRGINVGELNLYCVIIKYYSK